MADALAEAKADADADGEPELVALAEGLALVDAAEVAEAEGVADADAEPVALADEDAEPVADALAEAKADARRGRRRRACRTRRHREARQRARCAQRSGPRCCGVALGTDASDKRPFDAVEARRVAAVEKVEAARANDGVHNKRGPSRAAHARARRDVDEGNIRACAARKLLMRVAGGRGAGGVGRG